MFNTVQAQLPKVINIDGITFNNNNLSMYPPSQRDTLYLQDGIFKYRSSTNTITVISY